MSDDILKRVYAKLKKVRVRDDLSLRHSKYLKERYIHFDGSEREFRLRYYQVQGVLHLISMKRFILGDACGLGKTPTTIAALSYVWERNPNMKAIVFTNKSAVVQWGSEFERFTQGVNVIINRGTPKKREKAREAWVESEGPTVMIMGYRSLVQDFTAMQDWDIGVIVYDEATAFKSEKTQVHQRCYFLSQNAERTWGLSATIIKNNLLEGWGIYRVIVPGLFGTRHSFLNRYCVTRMQPLPGGRRKVPVLVGYRKSDIEDFKDKIDPYFLGRAQFEVASELPVLTQRRIPIQMNRHQIEKYNEALSGLLEIGEGDETEERETTQLTAIIYCQQIVNHLKLLEIERSSPKEDQLLDLLTEGEFAEENVIVYTRFRRMVDILMPVLEAKGIKATRITGAENEDERKAAQDAFQSSDDDTRVIIITSAASEAINLQTAKAIFFYDTPWSAGEYIQILGRMIRIGSVHDRVYALHFVTRNSIDVRVMEVLQKKINLINQVIGKRIKGEDEADAIVKETNDISDLFAALKNDAKSVAKKGKKKK